MSCRGDIGVLEHSRGAMHAVSAKSQFLECAVRVFVGLRERTGQRSQLHSLGLKALVKLTAQRFLRVIRRDLNSVFSLSTPS
jgi:hypothetical protein